MLNCVKHYVHTSNNMKLVPTVVGKYGEENFQKKLSESRFQ